MTPSITKEAGAADAEESAAPTPADAFDALYTRTATGLVRQTYLLTGERALAHEAVERAFHHAWQRWPEVAVDRDPDGWVRAAAYEYALSPWHRLRRTRQDDGRGGEDRPALPAALLALPPSHRRALLLHDGLGLDLPETAAEMESSTRAAANRLLYARRSVAERLPELSDAGELHEQLDSLTRSAPPPSIAPADAVRTGCERRARFWTRTTFAFTALIVGATCFTVATAPTCYSPPQAPSRRVGGLPLTSGPQRLSREDLRLRDRLADEPANGPQRLVPLAN
ncbi:sigma factor-like helix-turn-helix DNA-binding protein [Streptomyces sp. NPDC088725]|uniref:sigma factor-like helix-turn-helix DNA-binding protein n=1 Tax=Streptomyces sp. NPDC088725 TaxID=3365873 RepID=UPI0038166043